MKGSVRLKGKTWSYRIDLGKVDGKRKQIEKSGYKTEREAVKAMNDVIYHYNRTGEYLENQRFTFQQNYEQFIKEEAPATRAYATIQKYESMYRNHLKEEFGPSYLYQISPNRIREFLNTKSLEYSAEYFKSLYKALNVLFAYAYRNKRMKVNPMDEVTLRLILVMLKSIITYRERKDKRFRSGLCPPMCRWHTIWLSIRVFVSVNVLRYDGVMLIFRTGRFVSISNFVMKTANGVLRR